MYEQLQSLDNLSINFGSSEMVIVNIILAFIMFGVALDIKITDFGEILRHPKPVIVGLSAQLIILPAITFCLVSVFYKYIPPGVAMGMLLVSACPGGNISNFISSLAKANTALSVSLTSITTILAVVTTPLNFQIWGGLYAGFLNKYAYQMLQPLHINFSQMLLTLIFLILTPLVSGMLLAHFCPVIKEKILKPVKASSFILFIIILVGALTMNIEHFANNLKYIFLLVLFHNIALILSGYGWAALFRLQLRDRHTIAIETGIQNSGLGLGLLLNKNIFPAGTVTGGMVFLVAWWSVWDLIPGLVTGLLFRYIRTRKETHLSGKATPK